MLPKRCEGNLMGFFFFHLQRQILSKPQCHLLARRSVGDFFFPALQLMTNCRHASLPHCSSCSYIQSLTSAVLSPNMCARPVKPDHCVRGGFTMRDAFYNSAFCRQKRSLPLISGRLQTNVLGLTAVFLGVRRFFLYTAFVVVCRRGS